MVVKESICPPMSMAKSAKLGLLLVLFCTVFFPSPAFAIGPPGFGQEFIWLHVTQNTSLSSVYPDTPQGSDTHINISGPNPYSHGLVRFNIDPLPQGVEVTRAELRLFLDLATVSARGTIEAAQPTFSWSQDTVTLSNAPFGMTGPTSTYTIAPPQIGGYKTWDVTPIVQSWVDGAVNNGFLLRVLPESIPQGMNVIFPFKSTEYIRIFHGGQEPLLYVWYRRPLYTGLIQILASIFSQVNQPTPTPAIYPILPPPSPTPTPPSLENYPLIDEITSVSPSPVKGMSNIESTITPTPTPTPINPSLTPTPTSVNKILVKPSPTPTSVVMTKPSPTSAKINTKNVKGAATDHFFSPNLATIIFIARILLFLL